MVSSRRIRSNTLRLRQPMGQEVLLRRRIDSQRPFPGIAPNDQTQNARLKRLRTYALRSSNSMLKSTIRKAYGSPSESTLS